MKKGGSATGANCPLTMTVETVGMDTINGIPLRSMTIKDQTGSEFCFGGKVIESIGHLTRPRPAPQKICERISDIYDYFGLRCMDNSYIGFYDFKIVPSCDYVTSVHEASLQTFTISCFPNPNPGKFTIKASNNTGNVAVVIYDLPGRIVFQQQLLLTNNESKIAQELSDGLYVLEVKDEHHHPVRQIINIKNH